VSLSGAIRTLVRSVGPYGGGISGLAWTRPPAGVRYRTPRARVLARVRNDGLTAPWSITRLATDGERVAYVSCGHVFVWTPSTRGTWECRPAQLVVEDAARGLTAYVLDGQVHVLRLTDGADATVGTGTLARFTAAGLVYANDATLRLVPFDELPIH
jgi:uncharacterized cupin superfamily protein